MDSLSLILTIVQGCANPVKDNIICDGALFRTIDHSVTQADVMTVIISFNIRQILLIYARERVVYMLSVNDTMGAIRMTSYSIDKSICGISGIITIIIKSI